MSGLLGARIRQARKRNGMSQSAFITSFGINVSVPYLSDMELGKRNVPMSRLFEFCNCFPDEDSAEWLWLKLVDEWGQSIADVMRKHAGRPAREGEGE